MLSGDEISVFRQRLLQLQQDLLVMDKTGQSASSTVILDQTSVGRLSRMDALQGQAISQEMNRRRQLELKKIEAALNRIESSDYGYCTQCEEQIATKRLEFDPSASLCIQCAAKNEQQ